MRFNDAYIICIETISVHAFRSDAKLKPFQMRFMFTGRGDEYSKLYHLVKANENNLSKSFGVHNL